MGAGVHGGMCVRAWAETRRVSHIDQYTIYTFTLLLVLALVFVLVPFWGVTGRVRGALDALVNVLPF